MTYKNVVKRGWYCKCSSRKSQKSELDKWNEWILCGKCRLPIKGSNQPRPPLEHKTYPG